MKIDLNQSCRAMCDIEKVDTILKKEMHVIPCSTDAIEVKALQQRKALVPNHSNAP